MLILPLLLQFASILQVGPAFDRLIPVEAEGRFAVVRVVRGIEEVDVRASDGKHLLSRRLPKGTSAMLVHGSGQVLATDAFPGGRGFVTVGQGGIQPTDFAPRRMIALKRGPGFLFLRGSTPHLYETLTPTRLFTIDGANLSNMGDVSAEGQVCLVSGWPDALSVQTGKLGEPLSAAKPIKRSDGQTITGTRSYLDCVAFGKSVLLIGHGYRKSVPSMMFLGSPDPKRDILSVLIVNPATGIAEEVLYLNTDDKPITDDLALGHVAGGRGRLILDANQRRLYIYNRGNIYTVRLPHVHG